MSDIANKVETLMEAMPYLQKYQGKIIVIKYGGNAMINEELKDAVMHDVVLLKLLGMKPVLSHGGGPGINKMLEKLDIPVEFIEGLRYTSADIMRVVEMVLVGQVNTELVGFINKLGGKDWQKTRSRVRSAVKDMAKELTELYSRRLKIEGHAFSPDTDMQSDFERRFEFDETSDQLRCIDEIKGDMERSCPMDRLLCGDVGFGKTEVALRGAFKCVADGKQCAILVPTTILAYQHYQTVLKRIEGFPVEARMLSRFCSKKEIEDTLNGLRRGSVDIVVGTHRLISKDVQFRDLGLIIIDEEQRFGVAQKEKLKELYPKVDVLTLTATPIPRTLNMALSGIRDMSILEEAPHDRSPVQTYVVEHNPEMLAQAQQKLAAINSPPLLLCQSMPQLELLEKVDAAICCLDSINYLTRPRDVQRTFARLHDAIAPGGSLVFDVHAVSKMEKLDGEVLLDEREDVFCLWRTRYRKNVKMLDYEVDLFRLQPDGAWERDFEEHHQRAYTVEELTAWLEEAGFTAIRTHGELKLRRANERDGRIYFSCIRK